MDACLITETTLGSGHRAITLENDRVAVTVLPEKGADIYALIFKPKAMDVLWKSPWGLQRRGYSGVFKGGNTEAAWMDQYEGGWQEIFPNGGDECVYQNAPLNFHGEASISEWDCSIVQADSARVAIEVTVELRRSPFRLKRTMTVERDVPGLLMHEEVTNLADEDLAFMWGHHPAVGGEFLASGLRLHAPARSYLRHPAEGEPLFTQGKPADAPYPASFPDDKARFAEFGYLTDLDAGWYGLTSDRHGFGFGLAWPVRVFPHLWLWQERRGSSGYPWYGRCSVMAVEPFNSIPGSGLTAAIAALTAPILSGQQTMKSDLAAVFYEASMGDIESIALDGTVLFR